MIKLAKTHQVKIFISTLFLSFCHIKTVQALPAILDSWQATYPASNSDSAGCQLCHQSDSGGDGWNGYGWAVRQAYMANGGNSATAFTTVQPDNSDNDPTNSSNGAEIIASTQPGWTEGQNNTIFFKDGTNLSNQSPPASLTQLDPIIVLNPDINVDPVVMDFSAVVGTDSAKNLKVSNVGSSTLTISSIAICSGNTSEFNLTGPQGTTVAPGGEVTISVTYHPNDIGIDSDCLNINSNDPDESVVKVQLNGHGLDPNNQLTDVDIDNFSVSPNAEVGLAPVKISLAVTNNGLVQGSVRALVTGILSGQTNPLYTQEIIFDSGFPGFSQVLVFNDNYPQSAGTIEWTAEIEDQDPDQDSANASTAVISVALDNPIPETIQKSNISVAFETVASGLVAPNYATFAPGVANQLYVVDQPGQVWRIDLKSRIRTLFMDVSQFVVPLGIRGANSYDERGFLGLAFHPDYANNGLVYTYTSELVSGPPDFPTTLPMGVAPNHQAVVTEWHVDNPTFISGKVDMTNDATSGRRVLMRIDEPQFNHNGGAIAFGPEGYLYISLGDGGAADDQGAGHGIDNNFEGKAGNGQNPHTPLGAILRIDPLGSNSPNTQYGIPSSNPFYGKATLGLGEVYAYGFRNVFRMSFDSKTGDLYAGDVGQNKVEEVNVVVNGGNYGWNRKEGTFFFYPNHAFRGFTSDIDPGDLPSDFNPIDPWLQYDHDEGIAVTGGFVYRGRLFKGLSGTYVFGDWSKSFGTPSGRLLHQYRNSEIREFVLSDRDVLGIFLNGFGQDENGEIYIMGNKTGIPFRSSNNVATGQVLKMIPGSSSKGGGKK